MVARIKKNDTVHVISGKDKGKQGSVVAILPKKDKVLVKGVALLVHHKKPRRSGEVGGIHAEESFIEVSRVMPVCPSCKKPSRTNAKRLDTGKNVRVCNRCKEIF